MKNFLKLFTILILAVTITSCNSFKKMKNKVSLSDAKKVAELIDMDFGSGPDGPFDVSNTTNKDSTLIVQNNTDRTITVKAKGKSKKTFVVRKGKSKSAIVKPGEYHFVATAKGTRGCKGDVVLKRFKKYKWIFVIKK